MLNKRPVLRSIYFPAILLLMAMLGGCNLPSDEPCTESELTYVEDTAPHDTRVNTLTPVLTWRYPDPTCYPGLYHIEIYDQDIIGGTYDHSAGHPSPIHQGQSDGPYYSVPASAGLQPGKTYAWMVSARTAENRGRGGSVIDWFTTGPLCGAGADLLPPIPLFPPDGAEMYFPDSVKLHWENQMTCWPAGDIYLQISTREDFSVPVWYGDTHVEYIWIQDTPPTFEDCTRYFWRVRTDPAGSGEGPYSETRSFVLRRTATVCPLELGPVITLIPPSGVRIPPSATLKINANCRSGPGMDYPVLAILPLGLSLEVNGRDQESTWWQVADVELQKDCWLSGNVITIDGDASDVQVVTVAPPPAAVPSDTPVPPVNCGQYNTNTCSSQPACTLKGGTCVNK